LGLLGELYFWSELVDAEGKNKEASVISEAVRGKYIDHP
jgi:hypothetical protein